jgi:uncharacterized protein YjdB
MKFASFVRAAAMLACALALSACGGTQGAVAVPKAGVPLFTSAAGTVTLAVGASVTLTVGGGGGGATSTLYSATSNTPAIATASISGDKLTIKAVAAGSANITVIDSSGSGQTVVVPVTVSAGTPAGPGAPPALYSTAQATLFINAGASPVYLIGGGSGPYLATTNNASVATASVSGNTLTINGVASGSATIAAFDATGKSLEFAVTVSAGTAATPAAPPALYSTAQATLFIKAGASPAYLIFGGSGPYLATTNNASVATASISGNTLTINGVASGSATIAAFDASGKSLQFAVTVSADTPTAPVTPPALYSTAQATLFINAGASPAYLIGGGSGPYLAATNNASVATASVSGNTLTINGVSSGSATIAAFDATGKSLQFAVTVPGPASSTPLYSTAQSAIALPVGATPSYLVAGGTAPYTTTSSNASVASATVNGNVLSITGVGGGTATIAIFDAAGTVIHTTATVDSAPTPKLYTTAPGPLALGASAVSYSYLIGGGTAPYSVNSSAPAIATATVSGNTLKITGIANGSANIVVFDAAGTSVTTAVVVGSGAVGTTALYTTAQNAITVAAASSTSFIAGGGVGPYVVTTNDAAIATATVSGNTLTIQAIAPGKATIRLSDAASASTLVNVDVGAATMLYTTAPGNVIINAGAAPSYTIRGGVAPYVATSSAAGFVAASVHDDVLTISGVSAGAAEVIVLDAAGNRVSIQVTVP